MSSLAIKTVMTKATLATAMAMPVQPWGREARSQSMATWSRSVEGMPRRTPDSMSCLSALRSEAKAPASG